VEDKRDVLREKKPFSYRLIGNDKAQILYAGRPVFMAVGKDYKRLQAAIGSADEYAIQMAMAKMTGNFKRGNER
jgi:hypothetical protein